MEHDIKTLKFKNKIWINKKDLIKMLIHIKGNNIDSKLINDLNSLHVNGFE